VLLPLGQHTNRYRQVVASYLGGTAIGASTTALAAWLASGFVEPLPAPVRAGLLVAAALVAWAVKADVVRGRLRLPENRRQIPFEVFGRGVVRGAWRFGFEMGTGVRTYVPTAAPYVLLAGLVLARPTLGHALLAAVGFGLGRAIPLMVSFSPDTRISIANDLLRAVEQRFSQAATGLVVLAGALLLA
jgi:hypothetical protein